MNQPPTQSNNSLSTLCSVCFKTTHHNQKKPTTFKVPRGGFFFFSNKPSYTLGNCLQNILSESFTLNKHVMCFFFLEERLRVACFWTLMPQCQVSLSFMLFFCCLMACYCPQLFVSGIGMGKIIIVWLINLEWISAVRFKIILLQWPEHLCLPWLLRPFL